MEIPKEVLAQFAELGAFGALVPPEYEGAGMNNSQMAKLAEIVGAHDLGLGVVMGAHQSIGYKGILLFGTEEQKAKYLPDLASGRKFAAFCLTEPSSGSDANSIRSRAVKSPDGKHYILDGSKIWISNGGFAEIFTVFAQTPIKMPDGSTKDKVSAFIVERAFGGVTSGPQEKKMGIKGSNTTEIPVENLLGVEGEGFKVAMNILNNGRFGIPAACTGAMKLCIQKTVDHITQRVQFGQTLQEFFNVQEKLTNMIARHYATESIVYLLSSNMDRGIQDYQLEAAIGKVAASENAWWVCDEAIQLHGGMGFMTETGLERVMRDLRIFRIFEGANDVMRLFVALTGAQHAGKHLQQVAKEIKSGGIGTLFGQVVKRATGGSTGANFEAVVDPGLIDSAKQLDSCIKEFGKTVENLLIKYKKEVIGSGKIWFSTVFPILPFFTCLKSVIQEKLTNMIARHYATESIVYLLSSNMDRGIQDYQLEAAIGKVAASENAWWVCDEAIQLHGGMGFMTETGLERVMRDLRIFRIFEGANDVMRLFVALTGAQHAGKHLQQVAKEIKSGGIGTLFGQVVKRATGGSTGANFEAVVDPGLIDSAKQLDSCIKEFGKTVENLLIKYKKGAIGTSYFKLYDFLIFMNYALKFVEFVRT
ncbi:member 9, family protein, acyl-CoA dehydrogenase family [Ancylostoma duodenale]|uniref:Very long-chain specific acyl-CoA dehydrogenase, mitochondrial n=1 Tax=Ancylostoma duodenale TaxID=51022 RepID=A0A0C2GV01_9BILA|nr:member 9, family protein, acyl-CoA dehydrogenase family [Ancylostoma duodenale]